MPLDEELGTLIESLTNCHKPKEILLFGSRAGGKARADSDIDLCLIYDKLPKRKLEVLQELYLSIFSCKGHAVDLVVFQTDAFDEKSRNLHTFESEIRQQGRVVYGRA